MYQPEQHREDRLDVQHDLIETHPFGLLISQAMPDEPWGPILLFGFAGEVNFGPTFLIGTGAYTAGILNNQYGWSVYVCILLGALAPLASFALFHLVTVFPLSWVTLFAGEQPVRFLAIEAAGAVVCILAILASGLVADRVGRRAVLGVSAVLIAVYSGFAPRLLDSGSVGEAIYMLGGFVLLGLAFGQSSGVVNSAFPPETRYTGAAIVANSAWLIGAGFAPLVALFIASRFGLWSVGVYLLSGAAWTLGALAINKEWARKAA